MGWVLSRPLDTFRGLHSFILNELQVKMIKLNKKNFAEHCGKKIGDPISYLKVEKVSVAVCIIYVVLYSYRFEKSDGIATCHLERHCI